MSRQGFTGNGRLWFVASIANPAAPTVAELTAGIDLTPFLVRDTLATPASASTLDASDASSRQNKTAPGNYGGDPVTATFHRESVTADDDAWSTLVPDTDGNLVVRRFGGSALAPAAGHKVEVYPGSVNTRVMASGDQTQRFDLNWTTDGEVEQDATVAA